MMSPAPRSQKPAPTDRVPRHHAEHHASEPTKAPSATSGRGLLTLGTSATSMTPSSARSTTDYTPGRVLSGEPQHQRADRGAGRWPALHCWRVRVGPLAGEEFAVPAQQRPGAYEATLPQRSGEVAGERGHDQPVGGLEPKAGCLATQHADLMADQDQFPRPSTPPRGHAPRSEFLSGRGPRR
jgi:hypothetical protein